MEPPTLPQELISGLADVYHTSHRAGGRQARKREHFLFLPLAPPLSEPVRKHPGVSGLCCRRCPANPGQAEDEDHESLSADAQRGSAQRQSPEGAAGSCGEAKEEVFHQEQAWRGPRHPSVLPPQHQLTFWNIHLCFSEGTCDVCPGFSSEAELLAHLSLRYDSAVSGSSAGLLDAARHLLSAVRTFFSSSESDEQVRRVCLSLSRCVRSRMDSPVQPFAGEGGCFQPASPQVQQEHSADVPLSCCC